MIIPSAKKSTKYRSTPTTAQISDTHPHPRVVDVRLGGEQSHPETGGTEFHMPTKRRFLTCWWAAHSRRGMRTDEGAVDHLRKHKGVVVVATATQVNVGRTLIRLWDL
jgi:hypothetical protein